MTDQIDRTAARDKLGGAPLTGVLASDLRVVSMDWVDGAPTEHIVLASELTMFVEACKRLHFSPGVNPANGNETARIWRLRVSDLMAHGPYWWAQPGLGDVIPRVGALTISAGISRTAWIDEEYEVAA